ncbi:OstA family organic solvent tolerance protein [hydrothermal vent metagenome]|uniref:OstA family organic solvent tolerance protein n=1 Tax=hydrothermal vent metagenome TaxID=652676 RepID=A0A1W1E7H6_9ZZZZ
MKYNKIIFLMLFAVLLWGEKVQITSDRMKAIDKKKEIHFIGNAKVSQLKDWIHGNEIIIYFDDNNETKKYVAKGKVTFELHQKEALYKGKADKVIYFPKKSEYILTGKAVIDDLINKRHINGDEIVLNILTGNANVKGNRKKPVKFIFDMEKKSE